MHPCKYKTLSFLFFFSLKAPTTCVCVCVRVCICVFDRLPLISSFLQNPFEIIVSYLVARKIKPEGIFSTCVQYSRRHWEEIKVCHSSAPPDSLVPLDPGIRNSQMMKAHVPSPPPCRSDSMSRRRPNMPLQLLP